MSSLTPEQQSATARFAPPAAAASTHPIAETVGAHGGTTPQAHGGHGGGGGFSLRNLRTFTSFKFAPFRWFYASMVSQMAAMQVEMIARGLLIYAITHSATMLGWMAVAQSIPMLAASFGGGVMADRIQKKHLMVFGMGANALIALSVAVAISFGMIAEGAPWAIAILLIASVAKGAVQGLIMPARQSIIPELVGREQIMNALALNNLGMNLLRILAPAGAGFAVAFWGYESAYYVMTGLFTAATLFALRLPRTGVAVTKGGRAVADLIDGFKYLGREPTVALVLFFTLFAVLLSMPYMQMLPIFTETVLQVGPEGMGILVMISGIGAVVGSLVLASLPNRYRGLMLVVSSLIMGLALTVFSFSSTFTVSALAIIFVGIGQTGRMTLAGTLLQHYVEDEYRGRVMAIYMMEFGLTSLSVLLAGILADRIGIQWSIGGMALILIVISIGVLIASPRLRRLH